MLFSRSLPLSRVVDEHREYIQDHVRVDAFRRALQAAIRPGDVVLDLASGTSILGMLACRAGAARVYSVDHGGIIGVARQLARANGLADRMVFIKGFSTRIELPEKVDVLLADQIGHFGFEAGVFNFFDDARRRFLKPGGRVIPIAIDFYLALIQSPEIHERVEFWNQSPEGFDLSPAHGIAANTGYPHKFLRQDVLGEAAHVARVSLLEPSPRLLRFEARLQAPAAATVYGIGGWFSAELAPGILMTNSPLAEVAIGRRNVFFPIQPQALQPGDSVQVAMDIIPTQHLVKWEVQVWPRGAQPGNGGRPRFRSVSSTFRGMLMTREDLERTRPDHVPSLSPYGKARGTIIELCDGRRTLAEVEREFYARHQDLFASSDEASEFVAEVITRYST